MSKNGISLKSCSMLNFILGLSFGVSYVNNKCCPMGISKILKLFRCLFHDLINFCSNFLKSLFNSPRMLFGVGQNFNKSI